MTEFESDETRAALEALRASGYRVEAGAVPGGPMPEWLAPFQPDYIARRGREFVVLEVKRRSSSSSELQRLVELAEAVSRHHEWALELLWLGEGELRVDDTLVADLIARAELVLRVDVEAALLVVWPAVEASLRTLASRVGLREQRPHLLLSELYSLGWLSERHFNELSAAQEARNDVAHHVGIRTVDADLVRRIAEVALRLAEPGYVPVDQMVEWFQDRYMDPANGVPHDSAEGGYQYINGGPYDALEELSGEFPEALADELEDAKSLLEQEAYEWVRKDEY